MASFQSLPKRGAVLFAFWSAVVLSLPAWWYLTSIQRLALPHQQVQGWVSRADCPIRIPVHVVLHVAHADAADHRLRSDLEQHVQRASTPNCEEVEVQLVSEAEELHDTQPPQNVSPIHVWTSSDAPLSISSELASFTSTQQDEYAMRIQQALWKLLQLDSVSTSLSAREIVYSRRVRTVWHLLNEDASVANTTTPATGAAGQHARCAGVRGWNAQALQAALLKHVGPIARHLDAIHDIATESQVRWHAPLDFEPVEVQVPVELAQRGEPEENEVHASSAKGQPDAARDGTLDTQDSSETEAEHSASDAQNDTGVALPELPQPRTVHLITPDDLTVFVNSAAWGLSTPSPAGEHEFPSAPWSKRDRRRKAAEGWGEEELEEERTLHFVLFVAKPSHRPLFIHAPDSATAAPSNSSGFLVPQWGGVYIHNIEEDRDSEVHGPLAPALEAHELEPAMRVFASQLRALLGTRIPLSPRGSTATQKEARIDVARQALLRRRIAENAREATRTLDGIVRLTDKIENLGIGPRVRDDVLSALQALDHVSVEGQRSYFTRSPAPLFADIYAPEQLEAHLRGPNNTSTLLSSSTISQHLTHALWQSNRAASHASRAFFNRDMLALLYFPAEHKYAVYTPLFGPIAVPLLVASARLLKERRTGKKEAVKAVETIKDR